MKSLNLKFKKKISALISNYFINNHKYIIFFYSLDSLNFLKKKETYLTSYSLKKFCKDKFSKLFFSNGLKMFLFNDLNEFLFVLSKLKFSEKTIFSFKINFFYCSMDLKDFQSFIKFLNIKYFLNTLKKIFFRLLFLLHAIIHANK
jgi:hypothetical protein